MNDKLFDLAWELLRDLITEAENRYGLTLYGRVDSSYGYTFVLTWVCLMADFSKEFTLTHELLLNKCNSWSAVENELKQMAEVRNG